MGIEAAQSMLHYANDAIDKEDRLSALSDLQSRVEDWKGHKVDHFGELLLYGNFTVLKGEGAREVEREVSAVFQCFVPAWKIIIHPASPRVTSEVFPDKGDAHQGMLPFCRRVHFGLMLTQALTWDAA